jgi:hypothetical protein
MKHVKSTTIIGAVLLGSACGGGTQVPAQDLAQTQASIRAASEAGAENDAVAAARLKVANDTVERARKVARDGDLESSKALLKDAQADADLALALTRAKDAEDRTIQAKRRLEGLQ